MRVNVTTPRMLLAKGRGMKNIVGLSIGAAAGGLLVHERSLRTKADRLSAAALETLLNTIDANDETTGAHVRRVAAYSLILGEAAGFDEHTLRTIERVALFHDIGKLHGALTDIFHEQSKLTPEERRAVMTHPQRGAEVLSPWRGSIPICRKRSRRTTSVGMDQDIRAASRARGFRSRRGSLRSRTASMPLPTDDAIVTRAA